MDFAEADRQAGQLSGSMAYLFGVADLEDDERAVLFADTGRVPPALVMSLHWRIECVGVLRWALGQVVAIPPERFNYDQLDALLPLTPEIAVAAANEATLRPLEELLAARSSLRREVASYSSPIVQKRTKEKEAWEVAGAIPRAPVAAEPRAPELGAHRPPHVRLAVTSSPPAPASLNAWVARTHISLPSPANAKARLHERQRSSFPSHIRHQSRADANARAASAIACRSTMEPCPTCGKPLATKLAERIAVCEHCGGRFIVSGGKLTPRTSSPGGILGQTIPYRSELEVEAPAESYRSQEGRMMFGAPVRTVVPVAVEPARPLTGPAFEAVMASPHSIEARLVLADSLLEQGNPRGNFIAAQCRGHRTEVDSLLKTHFAAWADDLQPDEFLWVNGFVEDVFLAGERATRLLAPVLQRHPVTRLQLGGLDLQQLQRVLALPGIERLEVLDLSRCLLGETGGMWLSHHAAVRGLRSLRLSACGLGPRAAAALARSIHLRHLERLDVSHNAIGQSGIEALAHGRTLTQLKQVRAFRSGAPTTALEQRFGLPFPRGPAGLLLVELPAWVRPTGLQFDQVFALSNEPVVLFSSSNAERDLRLASVTGASASFRLESDDAAILLDKNQLTPIFVNGGPIQRTHRLQHGDLVEMPYRANLCPANAYAPRMLSPEEGDRRGVGLIFVAGVS